jgi:hypothetical protein
MIAGLFLLLALDEETGHMAGLSRAWPGSTLGNTSTDM